MVRGGVGREISREFIQNGCKVIIAARSSSELQSVSSEYKEEQMKFIQFDLLQINSFESFVKDASELFGRIDILVVASGTHTENINFWTVNAQEYDRVLDTNLKGVYFLCRVVAKYMIDNHIKGHIVNIISAVASEPAWSPYRISKRALKGMTVGLAKILLPYGIIVNGIAPDSVATRLMNYSSGDKINTTNNKVGRMVMPQEIADFALLLASDFGIMTTGDILYVSGGRGIIDKR